MTVHGAAGGFPPGFYNVTAPKWCRHKEQFVAIVSTGGGGREMTCFNCGAVATGADSQQARDALLKIEKVAIVSEVAAP